MRHDDPKADIWTRLSEPCPVASGEKATVIARKRLDAVVPGEWDLTLEALPPDPIEGGIVFKARLQIVGVIRESTSSEKCRTYFEAVASAFINACAMFGIECKPQAQS